MLYKKPRWSWQRLAFFAGASTFLGIDVGDIAVLGLRLRFMRSLDDPHGFKQSLKTIYHQTRQQGDNSMVITTKTSRGSQTNSSRPASGESQSDDDASQWSWSERERPSGSLSQSQPEVNQTINGNPPDAFSEHTSEFDNQALNHLLTIKASEVVGMRYAQQTRRKRHECPPGRD